MPSAHEVIEDGAVLLVADEIVEVGRFRAIVERGAGPVLDAGDTALLPGFINAHVHLKLGHLAGRIGPPDTFTDWLRDVMRLRETDPAHLDQVAAEGVQASLAGGATTVVDITDRSHVVAAIKRTPIRKLVHLEVLGFDEESTRSALAGLRQQLREAEPDDLLTIGVSPHAPYSTSEALYRECARLAEERHLPLCSHVAETAQEEEFIRTGTGPFQAFLEELGVSTSGWRARETTPVQYLEAVGFFRRAPLLVHGNYIRHDDIPVLRNQNVTVVYCPRSHEYFGHPTHPFERLFALGVNVALGTDSLASTPTLSMLDEMKFLHRRHPHISPERILTYGTLNGAKTLKVRAKIGGLRAGWKADIVGVRVPGPGRRIAERVLGDESEIAFTMVGGAICYAADGIARPT